jgi:hypothetical protein
VQLLRVGLLGLSSRSMTTGATIPKLPRKQTAQCPHPAGLAIALS